MTTKIPSANSSRRQLLYVILCAILLTASHLVQAQSSHQVQTVLKVQGMHCNSCASMIRKTVRKVDGVQEVHVGLDQGEVVVRHDDAADEVGRITHAIVKMGYEVDTLHTESHVLPDSSEAGLSGKPQ